MMAGKPIIMSANSCNDPISEAKCGETVFSGKQEDLITTLNKFAAFNKKKLEELGMNGRNFVISNNTYENLAKQCISIFEKKLELK